MARPSESEQRGLSVLAAVLLLARPGQQPLLALDVRQRDLAEFGRAAAAKGPPVAEANALRHEAGLAEVDEGVAQVRLPGGAARNVDELVGPGQADVVQSRGDVLLRVPAGDVAQHHRGHLLLLVAGVAPHRQPLLPETRRAPHLLAQLVVDVERREHVARLDRLREPLLHPVGVRAQRRQPILEGRRSEVVVGLLPGCRSHRGPRRLPRGKTAKRHGAAPQHVGGLVQHVRGLVPGDAARLLLVPDRCAGLSVSAPRAIHR
mmetsp:Transcript_4009/g.10874  ORF Transcript_4009/g.10874 Transcript_4009/m.10874 type:complete len:262 (-) Transcript_4009:299-1084(-)